MKKTALTFCLCVLALGCAKPQEKTAVVQKKDTTGAVQSRIPHVMFEEKCIPCHTSEKFSSLNPDDPKIIAVIKEMQKKPGAQISVNDVDHIRQSMILLKCTGCHTAEKIIEKPRTPDEMREIINEMSKKKRADIQSDEIDKINKSLFLGQEG